MICSVIIPTRNRANNLKHTLFALSTQSMLKNEYEVIVSDDNSTDGTREIIESFSQTFNLRYIFNNHKKGTWNASTPRNLGAFVTDPESKFLIFVDSDVILPFNALKNYKEDYENNSKRVVIGMYHWLNPLRGEDIDANIKNQESFTDFFFPNTSQHDVREQKFNEVKVEDTFNTMQDGLACFGGNLMIPRNIFFKVGGYDDDTHIGLEDGEMGIRLWKAQINFSYDNRIIGYHQFHAVPPDRFPSNMKEHIDKLNQKHFNTNDPDFNLINATKEAFSQWGVKNWEVPREWLQ